MAVVFSENIEYFEKVIISLLLNDNDDYELADDGGHKVEVRKLLHILQPSFFVYPLHNSMIKEIKEFYKQNNSIPTRVELLDYLKIHNINFDDAEYKATTEVDLTQYTKDYVYKYLLAFIQKHLLNSQINKVAVNLKTRVATPETMSETFDYVRREFGENIDIDITNDDEGLDVFDPKSHIQPLKNTQSTGFEWLDYVLGGGYEPKTFVVLFGRPKVGKSLAISNMAVRAVKSGLNVCLITVELSAGKYTKRIGSNLFSIPKFAYDSFIDENSLALEKQYQQQFEASFPNHGKLITKEYPTGSISAFDIENFVRRMEKKNGYKFDVIFIDYLNLLNMDGVGGGDGGTYMPVKKTCEHLRKIAQRNEWCVVTATQAKQSAFEAEDLNMDDVAESSGVIATVDTLIGLISVPGSLNYRMKCVANRDNGFMGSYADYKKVFDFFRLEERTDGTNGHISMSSDDKKMLESKCLPTATLDAITVLQKTDDNNEHGLTDVKSLEVPVLKAIEETPLQKETPQAETYKATEEQKQNFIPTQDQQANTELSLLGKGVTWNPNDDSWKKPSNTVQQTDYAQPQQQNVVQQYAQPQYIQQPQQVQNVVQQQQIQMSKENQQKIDMLKDFLGSESTTVFVNNANDSNVDPLSFGGNYQDEMPF